MQVTCVKTQFDNGKLYQRDHVYDVTPTAHLVGVFAWPAAVKAKLLAEREKQIKARTPIVQVQPGKDLGVKPDPEAPKALSQMVQQPQTAAELHEKLAAEREADRKAAEAEANRAASKIKAATPDDELDRRLNEPTPEKAEAAPAAPAAPVEAEAKPDPLADLDLG